MLLAREAVEYPLMADPLVGLTELKLLMSVQEES